jgi:hypothetical protein
LLIIGTRASACPRVITLLRAATIAPSHHRATEQELVAVSIAKIRIKRIAPELKGLILEFLTTTRLY